MAKAERPQAERQDGRAARAAHLKVRPRRTESDDEVKPAVRAGTLYQKQDGARPEAEDAAEKPSAPVRKVALPGNGPVDGRYPYATHGPAPADEKEEKRELDVIAGRSSERQVSAGFLLGIALIAIALGGAVWIGRLGRRVRSLERQVASLTGEEAPEAESAETVLLER